MTSTQKPVLIAGARREFGRRFTDFIAAGQPLADPADEAGKGVEVGVRRRYLLPLALTATVAVGGCLDMTDYTWNVWLSNSSAQPFTVEVSRPAVSGPERWVDAYRLPPHSTMGAGGSGKGTDFVVDLYRPDCELALSVPVQRGRGFAYIDPAGAARVTQGLTQTPSDAPQPQNPGDMAISEGCSPEWKAAHPGFTMPPATSAPPSIRVTAPSPAASDSALRTVDVTAAPSGAVAACAGVGLVGATLRGDPHDPRVVWLDLGPNGTRGLVFPLGFTARFAPRLEVLDTSGQVRFREGDAITGACVWGNNDLLIGWP
jgi:hypothetical protein